MIDFNNKAFFKLSENADYAVIAADILLPDETVLASFKSMRDGVIFTSRRVIAVNVQGLTGKKKDFTSMPYRAIQAFSIETVGTFDLDAELDLFFSGVGKVRFEFSGRVDMRKIARCIAEHAL
ncbi:PH domain-containing protein [Paracoccus sp. N5]|uniref:PH domain-containing protein n=1 Tax=Paracoccus sp. N5 TaxID=1101189 RepID=UPI000366F2C6|nr:PH domain-containing protein [Paracoccus sp. N5]